MSQAARKPPSLGHAELWIATAITLAGFALRLWRFFHVGLTHFDEGVYAISGMWSVTPWKLAAFYPRQILFSPPLFVFLVGISYRLLGGASDQAAILVNAIMGGLTIALAWWIAKRWFGAVAAITAATLIALSDYQIAFSRSALTDVTFGFFFLLSLAWISIALEKGSSTWAIAAGLATGAAWNTKYHGWLPILISLLAWAGLTLTERWPASRRKQLLIYWLISAGVAVICYVPWAAYIHSQPGGYMAFAQYQGTFVNLHWLRNLRVQASAQWFLDGWLSRIGPATAFLLSWATHPQQLRLDGKTAALVGLLLLASGFVLGGTATIVAITLLVIPPLFHSKRIFYWMLLSAWAVLFLLTPFYRPYSRLVLPFLLTVAIGAGVGLQSLFASQTTEGLHKDSRLNLRKGLALAALGGLAVAGFFVGVRPAARPWMATDSVRKAAEAMEKVLPQGDPVIVHGAPEVAFYLECAGRAVSPMDRMIDRPEARSFLEQQTGAVFLVTGIYSYREPNSRASLQKLSQSLDQVGDFPIQPSDIRLLDDFSPSGALRYRQHPTNEYNVHLFQFDPAEILGHAPQVAH